MIVYAETNFILELALEQENHASCEHILSLAEAKRITLAVPAFCLVEASQTLERRHTARSRLVSDDREMGRELKQLLRSAQFSGPTKGVRDSIETLFSQSLQREQSSLRATNARLLGAATILPLSGDVILRVERSPHADLTVPDAIVLFSVLADPSLGQGRACFVSRDLAAFDDPDIRRTLSARQCKVLGSFEDASQYMDSQIPST